MNPNDVYGSGLNEKDWMALRDYIWPYLHAKEPSKVTPPDVPGHLKKHALVHLICQYCKTGEDEYLDEAGRYLIPTNEPFGWYVPLTK